MEGNTGAQDALAVWDALKPKIEQLIAEKTKSVVRRKKMNLNSVNTTTQTVNVYEGVNSSNNITIPYIPGTGIDQLVSGESVIVEWRSDDISTAVAVSQGRGWTDAVGTLPGVSLTQPSLSNPVLSGIIDVSGGTIRFMGDVLYTNSDPTQGVADDTSLVSGLNVQDRDYNLFLFEFCYSTDYPTTRNSIAIYIPNGTVPNMYVQGNVVWYNTNGGILSTIRRIWIYQTTDGTHTFWTMVAKPGHLATTSGNTEDTKYCIPLRIIGMHI